MHKQPSKNKQKEELGNLDPTQPTIIEVTRQLRLFITNFGIPDGPPPQRTYLEIEADFALLFAHRLHGQPIQPTLLDLGHDVYQTNPNAAAAVVAHYSGNLLNEID